MLRKIGKLVLFLLTTLLVIGIIVLFVSVDFSNTEDTAEFVQNKLEKTKVVGASIAIIKDNKIHQYINYGHTNPSKEKKVDPNTVFQIASLSKTVTATSVMELYESGKLNLDVSINQYIPFEIENPNYPDSKITIRMLLDHTSGIADNWDILNSLYTISNGGGDSPISLEEFTMEYLLEEGKWYNQEENYTKSKPGESFVYSNVGYGLLGYIVEQVSGVAFDEYTKLAMFKPLGMENSEWLIKQINTDNIAMPYSKGKEIPLYSFPTYPDGSLKTTILDFSKFLTSMSTEKDGVKILSEDTIQEMFTPHSNEGTQTLGWSYSILDDLFMKGLNNGEIIGHTGSDPGLFSLALYNRDKGTGLIIFMNHEVKLEPRTINLYIMIKRLVEIADM